MPIGILPLEFQLRALSKIMSFDDLHRSSGQLEPAAEAFADVGINVRTLAALMADSAEISVDDTELLARLESADTVASGVEARLDEILGTLDDMLMNLEPHATNDPQGTPCVALLSEAKPEHPQAES